MTSLVQVDPSIIRDMYGRAPVPAVVYAALDAGEFMGAGGVAWMGGRCWLWLDFVDASKGSLARQIVRKSRDMLKMAKQMGETSVFTAIDRSHPKAEKLLRTLGFAFLAWEPSPEGEKEVWHVRL